MQLDGADKYYRGRGGLRQASNRNFLRTVSYEVGNCQQYKENRENSIRIVVPRRCDRKCSICEL